MRKGGANDPTRRDRIKQATLELIAADGVHTVTHRKVADRAGVPLGSVTYYFDTLDTLLVEAFTVLRDELRPRYVDLLHAARTRSEALDVLVDGVCGDTAASEHEVRLLLEMYSYGNLSPEVHELIRAMERECREALALHFGDAVARALEALVEGWWIHQRWDPVTLDRGMVEGIMKAICDYTL
ncbi:TetR family transcriptional regulator [Streptomyces canus]|uniref:TetR/AcrR family transcriptional regulator n=1 Tax=Streptomyces canus TaxID=58343 RepID=UPI0033F9495C